MGRSLAESGGRLPVSEEMLIAKLTGQSREHEMIEVKGGGEVLNLFNPEEGIELGAFLDPEHMPRITNFDTVIISRAFAGMRGEGAGVDEGLVGEAGGDPSLLRIISDVALAEEGYKDTPLGREHRNSYAAAAAQLARGLFEFRPVRRTEWVVPVVRAGSNLAELLGIDGGVSIEVKRLRFRGQPDLLGAGVNLSAEVAEALRGRRVRLLECIVASGSTESVLKVALRNWGVEVEAVDCDAIVVCPVGAQFTAELGGAIGVPGEDRAVFSGGVLDPNWYVRYGQNDRLLSHFSTEEALSLIGNQVMGDAGDLTSNL